MTIMIDHRITPTQGIVLLQGENNQTRFTFSLPNEWDGRSMAGLQWEVRVLNKETAGWYAESLMLTDGEARFTLGWLVNNNYTGQAGPLLITLSGREGDAVLAKFLVTGICVGAIPEGEAILQANYFDDFLAKIESQAVRAEAAADLATEAALRAETIEHNPVRFDVATGTFWNYVDGEWVDSGGGPQDGRVYEVHGGTGVEVDNTDPANPVISAAESGSNENGSWLKTADGTLTCWKSVTSTSSATIAFGGHYIAGPIQLGDWPQAFVGDVFAQESVYRISGASPYIIGNEQPTATSVGSAYIGASSNIESTRVIHIVGFGRWK